MKIRTVSVERAYTLNLGNYESARLQAGITLDLDETDDPDQVYAFAVKFVDDRLSEDMDNLKTG